MRFFNSLWRIRFVCADPLRLISDLTDAGVIVSSVSLTDDLTAIIEMRRVYKKTVEHYFQTHCISFTVLHQNGIIWVTLGLLKRPILVFGILVFLILSLLIPSHILFVSVEGNEIVPANTIISAAEETGVRFGSKCKKVRSEKVKNYLLQKIPGLQWAGVNIRGCVVTIAVKEREEVGSSTNAAGIYSIVASRDGVVRQMTVYSGKALCTVGQTVRQGQVLVSGFEDCGTFIRAERADGEIFADTIREISVKTPMTYDAKGEKTASRKKYSVIFGKKRINLFKDTGISDTSCVKMYKQYYIKLPGNFALPFSIVEYSEERYEKETVSCKQSADFEWMVPFADKYLQSQMLSGSVISKDYKMTQLGDTCIYHGIYACREMIGQLRSEENFTTNE